MMYRIYRLKEAAREQFRWSAHTGGAATVKLKDYEQRGEIESVSPYAAWKQLSATDDPLRAGDLLEALDEAGNVQSLQIAKYIGFEKAEWWVPAPKPDVSSQIPVNSSSESPVIDSTL